MTAYVSGDNVAVCNLFTAATDGEVNDMVLTEFHAKCYSGHYSIWHGT